jgi:hypothetical protein
MFDEDCFGGWDENNGLKLYKNRPRSSSIQELREYHQAEWSKFRGFSLEVEALEMSKECSSGNI